ncbi:MAG: glycosyltransferase [Mogibacterium sp.]|nr:glycosyltransferase [Mogibacterium sp.]
MSQSEIKVSVIIPIYNAEDYLEDCLRSVTGQTLREIEILCVNDGSTDGSAGVVRKYAVQDGRIRLLEQENAGAGAARNTGLAQASGEYLSFLDADDFYEPEMLEKSYAVAKQNDADICVFYADLYDNDLKKYKECTWAFRREYFEDRKVFDPAVPPNNENIFRMFNGWAWDKLFRRAFIEEQGLRYQELRTTNDMYFVFMALAKAKRIVTLDECLIHQRVNLKGSLSRTREKSWKCFYEGLRAMQEDLEASGLMETYGRAFRNWCVNFSLWQLNTMHGKPFLWAYDLLHGTAYEEFGVAQMPQEEYFSESEYERIRKILDTPVEEYLVEQRMQSAERIRALNDRITELKATNKEQKKEISKLKKQLQAIKSSAGYRIGRAVTWLPRRIRKLFR